MAGPPFADIAVQVLTIKDSAFALSSGNGFELL
jgi:hypothetical protein